MIFLSWIILWLQMSRWGSTWLEPQHWFIGKKSPFLYILGLLMQHPGIKIHTADSLSEEWLGYLKALWFFSCDQAAPWMVQSVRLSVRPSVRHTFLTMFPSSYHHETFRSYYQWQKWRPCKRSRSEVKGQGHRGHNPTLPFPDCNSSLNSHMMIKWCI